MLHLTGMRKVRISNRLAIVAALLLTITSLTGINNPTLFSSGVQGQLAGSNVTETTRDHVASGRSATVKKNKGFKASLLLLRNR